MPFGFPTGSSGQGLPSPIARALASRHNTRTIPLTEGCTRQSGVTLVLNDSSNIRLIRAGRRPPCSSRPIAAALTAGLVTGAPIQNGRCGSRP